MGRAIGNSFALLAGMHLGVLLCLTLGAATALADMTPKQIARQAVSNFQHDYRVAAVQYTYLERDEEHDGTDKVTVGRVSPLHGMPYEFDISRNGKPLTAEQQAKEEAKYNRRAHENKEQQAHRMRDYEKDRAFLNEVPEAFDFKLLGERALNGRANYLLDCSPRPGYQAADSHASMFAHIHALMWVDKEDLQMARADAKVLDTISIGWILARIAPGASMVLEQTRLSHTDWLPSLIDVNGNARVLLVKEHPIHERISYYGFKPVGNGAVRQPGEVKTGEVTNVTKSEHQPAEIASPAGASR